MKDAVETSCDQHKRRAMPLGVDRSKNVDSGQYRARSGDWRDIFCWL